MALIWLWGTRWRSVMCRLKRCRRRTILTPAPSSATRRTWLGRCTSRCRMPPAPARPRPASSCLERHLEYLAVHRHTRLVTIGIGANDAFLCQETTADACASTAELQAVLQEIRANLTTIYTEIRDVAHYHGLLIALTYYSISYSDPAEVAGTEALNSAIASVTEKFGGKVADGFAALEDRLRPSRALRARRDCLSSFPSEPATSIPRLPGTGCWPRPSRTSYRSPPTEVASTQRGPRPAGGTARAVLSGRRFCGGCLVCIYRASAWLAFARASWG